MAMPRIKTAFGVPLPFAALAGPLDLVAGFHNRHLLAPVAFCGCCAASLNINRNRMHLGG